LSYEESERLERAKKRLQAVDKIIGLTNQKVLEIGCGYGESCYQLATEFKSEVVGTEIMTHKSWSNYQTNNLTLIEANLEKILSIYGENYFDRIISFVVWEHVENPYQLLELCQRLLKPSGKKYLHAYLYGWPRLSHLSDVYKNKPWAHLLYSHDEMKKIHGKELPWYFWCNRLSIHHYKFYFRKLGFLINHENHITEPVETVTSEDDKKILNLYPSTDLKIHGIQFGLEFDHANPKIEIPDPLYKNYNRQP